MPYNNILQADRDRIVNEYERGVLYQQVAATLDIAWQTALNAVNRFQ